MEIGNKEFNFMDKHYVMGILNITPNSFSDGGEYNTLNQALERVDTMVKDGADIIDIGGESTRPDYKMVSAEEEIERVMPVIEAIKQRFDIPISLDTYKPKVAKVGIEAGVDLINDIWGLKWHEDMAKVIAEANIPVCIMHNRKDINYSNFLSDVIKDIRQSIQIAEQAGIQDKKIILDPGIGFAKTVEMNLLVLKYLEEFHQFGYPILLGTSRKSVIGLTLNLPIDQREEGTIATTVIGAMKGCQFFRVHDVKANVRALKMVEAIMKA